jgi:hypothetical protein
MRHVFLLASPLAVAPGAPRMCEAPGTAVLVAASGHALRLAPCRARASVTAIALAAVTAPAHQHLHAAARAGERPGAVWRVVLPCSTHAPSSQQGRARAPLARPAHGRPPVPAAILHAHSRSTRVGRGGSNYLPVVACRRARSVKDPVLPRLRPNPAPAVRQSAPTATAPAMGGWGAAPGQAVVNQASQRQRSAHAHTPARGIQPRAAWPRRLRALQCLDPTTRPWVNSDEQAWVNFGER